MKKRKKPKQNKPKTNRKKSAKKTRKNNNKEIKFKKANDEQTWSCPEEHLPSSWSSPTTTLDRKRTTKRRRHIRWVEALVFVCFRSVHGWVGMNVWVNVCFYDAILVLEAFAPRAFLSENAEVSVEHICKCFLSRREGLRRGAVLRSICQASWPSSTSTLDRKRTSKRRRHVWWVEGFALRLF